LLRFRRWSGNLRIRPVVGGLGYLSWPELKLLGLPVSIADKPGSIAARTQVDVNLMLRAFGPIVLFKTFAKEVHSHSDNRVDLRIEILRSPEGMNRDVVFLDVFGRPLEVFLANEV
jgi:hypothetical protein